MKTQRTNNEKAQRANSLPHCGDFQKMAERMTTCCPEEGGAIDCCSIMRRMMDQGREAEVKETKENQKEQKGEENG